MTFYNLLLFKMNIIYFATVSNIVWNESFIYNNIVYLYCISLFIYLFNGIDIWDDQNKSLKQYLFFF